MADLSIYFRAMADRKRLRIAEYLARHDGVTITELGEELKMSQPLISWHVSVLRRAGIVKTRRTGRQVLCSLNRRGLATYGRQVEETFGLKGAEDDRQENLTTPREAVR